MPPPNVPAPETLSVNAVQMVQRRLSQPGYCCGGIDGVWGRETQNAIIRFQQGRGLQPNGQLNPATVGAMGLNPDYVFATR